MDLWNMAGVIAAVVGSLAALVVPAVVSQLKVAREIGSLTTELRHVTQTIVKQTESQVAQGVQVNDHETRLTIAEQDIQHLSQDMDRKVDK